MKVNPGFLRSCRERKAAVLQEFAGKCPVRARVSSILRGSPVTPFGAIPIGRPSQIYPARQFDGTAAGEMV